MAADKQAVASTDPVSETTSEPVEPDDEQAPTTEDDSEPDQEESLPLDQVFEILKNERRRTVLRYLAEHDEPVSLGDLAEHVAANENDTPVKQISSRERKCAYVGLYQCHLPKMDNMNIVEFNQNRGLVETGPNAPQLKQYMTWSESPARPWPVYYGTTAGAGLAAVLVSTALSAGLVTTVVGAAVMITVAGIAVAQHQSED